MIINDENIKEVDTVLSKARAIIVNKNKQFIVCEINESLALPGGTVEDGEDYHETIIREIEEELGMKIDNLEELVTVNYYHKDFPNLKSGNMTNRLNIVHYFYKELNDFTFGEKHLTEYEINNDLQIKMYTIEELRKLIGKESKNTYKKFTDRELEVVLDYLEDNKKEKCEVTPILDTLKKEDFNIK